MFWWTTYCFHGKYPFALLSMYEATLNIECDKQAHINLEMHPINIIPHPTLPASHPHLWIQNQTIICQYFFYIHKYNHLPLYHNYLVNMFKWTNNIPDQIKWGIIWTLNPSAQTQWQNMNQKNTPWMDPYKNIPKQQSLSRTRLTLPYL